MLVEIREKYFCALYFWKLCKWMNEIEGDLQGLLCHNFGGFVFLLSCKLSMF